MAGAWLALLPQLLTHEDLRLAHNSSEVVAISISRALKLTHNAFEVVARADKRSLACLSAGGEER